MTHQPKPNDCCKDKPSNDWCFSCVAATKDNSWCFSCLNAPHPKDEEEECKDC